MFSLRNFQSWLKCFLFFCEGEGQSRRCRYFTFIRSRVWFGEILWQGSVPHVKRFTRHKANRKGEIWRVLHNGTLFKNNAFSTIGRILTSIHQEDFPGKIPRLQFDTTFCIFYLKVDWKNLLFHFFQCWIHLIITPPKNCKQHRYRLT